MQNELSQTLSNIIVPELSNEPASIASQPSEKPKTKSIPRTLQLTGLLKAEPKSETKQTHALAETVMSETFSAAQLQTAWMAFAGQRKKFQAEFQMLSQPYELQDNQIVVQLLSPVHETMLNNIKIELTTFLREKLKNNAIQVTGHLQTGEEKKIIYTNREKFDFLAEKNPMLKELKDRLGLDTDF